MAGVKLSDPGNVVELAQKDQTYWAMRDERMLESQQLVEQNGSVDDSDPDNVTVSSNEGAVIVRKLAAMTGCQAPVIDFIAAESLKEIAERAADMHRGARFEMEMTHAQGARAPLAYDEAQSIYLRGWITGRLMLNENATQDGFIWDYTLFDPMSVYPRYGRRGLSRVSTISKTTVGEIMADWPKEAQKLYGKTPDEDETATMYGYYDSEQMALATDAGWLKKPGKHGYPYGVPWVVTLGPGAFYRQTANDQTNFTRYVGQGILDLVRDQIQNDEKVLTMLHTLVAKEADPPVVVYTRDDGEVVQIDLRSGARNILADTDKLELIKIGPNLTDLKVLEDRYREMIYRGTVPPVMFGDNASNLTGYLTNLLQGSARDLIYPYVRGLETYYTLLHRMMFALYQNFGLDMQVVQTDRLGNRMGGVNFTRAEAVQLGKPHIDVKFREITPQDETAKSNIAMGAVRDDIISRETARKKYYDVPNPIQEGTKVLAEKALMAPQTVAVASALSIQKMAQDKGLSVQDLLMLTQQVMGALGNGAPGGAPGGQPGAAQMAPSALPPELGGNAGAGPGGEVLGQAPDVLTPQNLDLIQPPAQAA